MLTREDDVDAHALHRQGWTISAIARHLGHDRKTIRAYLYGGRVAGQRVRPAQDAFEAFAEYCRARLKEDPHLWATALFDEVVALGYDRSYPSFTRGLRARALRPHCEPCHPVKGRASAIIEHPPGEETQFDWLELPDPPASWGWTSTAFLLVGALAHSGRWRGVLCEGTDQAQLVDALHRVSEALGGLTRNWRFDRMATVCHPDSGRVTATFAAVAKHYGVSVKVCPARRGNRKGVVEKSNHVAAQRWWRTLADDMTVHQAQASLDRWCSLRGDTRVKRTTDGKSNVATVAAREPLAPMPTPFPATISVDRIVSAQALVSFEGNRYSVPPELARASVTVSRRLGSTTLDIATAAGIVIARHVRAAPGASATIRDDGHVLALNAAALAASTTARPHRSKVRIPPGPEALAAAEVLRNKGTDAPSQSCQVVDLAQWAEAAQGRNTLT
ncbi:MAG: IS21 family transposase [Sporichthyaceae bacterium]